MGKIQIGRDKKRDYESVKFFAESVKPEKEAADEVQQPAEPAEVDEAPAEQARQEVQEEPAQEAQQAPEKKEVPVAKQPRKKGGKR